MCNGRDPALDRLIDEWHAYQRTVTVYDNEMKIRAEEFNDAHRPLSFSSGRLTYEDGTVLYYGDELGYEVEHEGSEFPSLGPRPVPPTKRFPYAYYLHVAYSRDSPASA